MSVFLRLISTALYVMLFQNFIFNGGYGISEAIRMSAKPRQLLPLALFITYFSTAVSAICALLDTVPQVHALSEILHALMFSGVLLLVYLLTMIAVKIYGKVTPRTVRRIGIAAFNTLVLAVPLISYRSAFTVYEAVGAGIGAGVAFVIAVLLINAGLKKLDANEAMPKCFKGTPALFIYTALLSLAFSGFSVLS